MSNLPTSAAIASSMDEHDQQLLSHVHPNDWRNPQPAECYDLLVVGGGTAGLVVAAGAAGLNLGLKIALIEKHFLGGDCLNLGCVPSKCLIRSARTVAEIGKAEAFGIRIQEPLEVDFPAVMQRMRQLRANISYHDSIQRFQQLGVDVFLGEGRFLGERKIKIEGHILRYKKAVIATGTRPAIPLVPGLETAGFLTNETVFSLTKLPSRLAVIGGGPIGCELAQAFQRFGCKISLFERNSHILNREDAEAAESLQAAFIREGIRLVLDSTIERVEVTATGKRLDFITNGDRGSIVVDEILIGAGRTPNVEGLNLEAVGVVYDNHKGVKINDYLQTTNPRIYAAGDICLAWKFTHTADAAARIVIKNILFSPFGLGRSRLSDLVIPWCTYTDPEIAHVGLYEHEAKARGIEVNTILIPLDTVDRAITDGETAGFVKIHHQKGSDRILGATIVANHAGEMISEITTAIVGKIGLNKLSNIIHPYPTQAEAIKKAADTYRRTLLTPNARKLLRLLAKFS